MKKARIEIGNIVREYREKAKMTQMELAGKLGYDSPQFVSIFERGLSSVPVNTLGRLISLLGIPEKRVLDILLKSYKAQTIFQLDEGKRRA